MPYYPSGGSSSWVTIASGETAAGASTITISSIPRYYAYRWIFTAYDSAGASRMQTFSAVVDAAGGNLYGGRYALDGGASASVAPKSAGAAPLGNFGEGCVYTSFDLFMMPIHSTAGGHPWNLEGSFQASGYGVGGTMHQLEGIFDYADSDTYPLATSFAFSADQSFDEDARYALFGMVKE
jgi:hypothetical protein